jgi:peptidoglycan/LPS O-acetylase OafA/YrhL
VTQGSRCGKVNYPALFAPAAGAMNRLKILSDMLKRLVQLGLSVRRSPLIAEIMPRSRQTAPFSSDCPSRAPNHLSYRPDIDGLRAVAVLAVVGFHAFAPVIPGGFVGVDVFFVISGFLITRLILANLDRGTFSFLNFYGRRALRIFPSLIVVLAACYAFGFISLLPNEFKQLGDHIAGAAIFVSNFVLMNEVGYFDNAAETKPLLHLWSLAIEEQFYILWPLLLWLSLSVRRNLGIVFLVLGLASFLTNVSMVTTNAATAFFSPISRFWELLIGCWLAYMALRNPPHIIEAELRIEAWLRACIPNHISPGGRALLDEVKSAIGILMIATAVFAFDKNMAFPGWWALLPCCGTFLLVWAGPNTWLNRGILSNRLLVGIGLISYPLYLWHWPLLSFARITESSPPSVALRIGLVIASFLLAWLTYRAVEFPLRFGARKGLKAFMLCICMIGIGGLGLDAHNRDGRPNRFPEMIHGLTSFNYDYRTAFREGTCFMQEFRLDESGKLPPLFENCIETPPLPNYSTILLWGDSMAAHLYRGLKEHFGDTSRLIQLTSTGCPPIIGYDAPHNRHCIELNRIALNRLIAEKPDRVILAGAWIGNREWRRVAGTIRELQKVGVKRIDLVGPPPFWTAPLPRLLYNEFAASSIVHKIPTRMTSHLDQYARTLELDREMDHLASEIGAGYISVIKILCNNQGCLTRLDDTLDSITQYDIVHLTSRGSLFVVSQFPK